MVYLLHCDRPYRHAKHYLGFVRDDVLEQRIDVQPLRRESNSSRVVVLEKAALALVELELDADGGRHRLLQVIRAAGISFTLVRTWPGGRARQQQLKTQGGASRLCPECQAARGVNVRTVQTGGA